jgi:hypothetical protein
MSDDEIGERVLFLLGPRYGSFGYEGIAPHVDEESHHGGISNEERAGVQSRMIL